MGGGASIPSDIGNNNDNSNNNGSTKNNDINDNNKRILFPCILHSDEEVSTQKVPVVTSSPSSSPSSSPFISHHHRSLTEFWRVIISYN